jgi:multiple sugar transport system substrate-binding protein
VAIWQAFRDAYSESVIFGKKPVPDAFSGAAQKVDQLASGS